MINDILTAYVKGNNFNFKNLKLSKRRLGRLSRIIFVGSRESYAAAIYGAGVFEELTDILISCYPAGEFRFAPTRIDSNVLLIAVSATGVENDILASMKRVKAVGGRVISVCTEAEAEVAKAAYSNFNPIGSDFSEVCFALSLLAIYIGSRVGMVTPLYQSVALRMADMLAGKIAFSAKYNSALASAGAELEEAGGIIACGRGCDYAAALEFSLKNDTALCYISELTARSLENKTVLAFISGKDYLNEILFYLNSATDKGASVLILTTEEIAAQISNPEGIIAVSGSLPMFNPIVLSEAAKQLIFSEEVEESA